VKIIASAWMGDAGFDVTETLKQSCVIRDDFRDDPQSLEYFDQAVLDGEVFRCNYLDTRD